MDFWLISSQCLQSNPLKFWIAKGGETEEGFRAWEEAAEGAAIGAEAEDLVWYYPAAAGLGG